MFPTSATGVNHTVYVLYAHLDKLLSGATPAQAEFTIREVPFSDNKNF